MSSLEEQRDDKLEIPSPDEPGQIKRVAELTAELLKRRYADAPRVLRGVHPKDHGCVEATFTVSEALPPEYQVGLFRKPGARFRAAIRFSNAAPLVMPDSLEPGPDGAMVRAHGSRGMAVKLYDVPGNRLAPEDGERTQDFLMINQPVFAFANIDDYLALNEVIFRDRERPDAFFARTQPPFDQAVRDRASTTFRIVRQVKSLSAPAAPPPPLFPFQEPPLSPLDNSYFSAAPFLFGKGRVMKFSAKPLFPMSGELGDAIDDPDYLRKALAQRMAEAGGKDVCFDFQVQVRSAESCSEADIENMSTLWDEAEHPFVTVARITIPPQDVSTPERREFCEALFYTPWHGLEDHRPLGGINRLRRPVYETSAKARGCPVSPDLPASAGKGSPAAMKAK